jgi:hypothetical protein
MTLLVSAALFPSKASAACLAPPGDVTGDGSTNVTDVQCNVLVNLWSLLGGGLGAGPVCAGSVNSPIIMADHNCDGIANVQDTLAAVNLALGLGLVVELDADADGCFDACDSDLDLDGDADFLDCSPVDSAVNSLALETCNGLDDNCNGEVDEPFELSVAESCMPASACLVDAVCQTPQNLGAAVIIAEVHALPMAALGVQGQWLELFNPLSTAINIAGYAIGAGGVAVHVINPGGGLFVPARGSLVLAGESAWVKNGGVWTNYAWSGLDLSALTGTLDLFDASGALVDSVPIGAPGFPKVAGASAALTRVTSDNGSPAAWASSIHPYGAGDLGTPGGPNRDVAPLACSAGEPKVCSDGNPCTTDGCDPVLGCVFTPNAAACSDGNPCTTGDSCAGGVCLPGPPLPCDDGNPCTADACVPSTGCTHAAITAPCSDGNSCTVGDSCVGGACKGGAALSCDDANPCTLDVCELGSCISLAQAGPCYDGNACTTGDACVEGFCVVSGALSCNDANPCTTDLCSPAAGCVFPPKVGACSDGNACTSGESCVGGVCSGGVAVLCVDSNPCTADSCSPSVGCVFSPQGGPCDDGNVCTVSDGCQAGACIGASTLVCVDGNPCTQDSCNPGSGCVFSPSVGPCVDGNACTVGETCQAGACGGGSAVACNDNNACTDDACLPQVGCVYSPNAAGCNDGNSCTTADQCVQGACVGLGGLNCNDNNPCTVDSCSAGAGCTFSPTSGGCSDGNVCTTGDFCQGGTCVASGALTCNDGNGCTNDACSPSVGCVFQPNAVGCNDGNACTTNDFCQNGGCTGGGATNCNDGNPCTNDGCNPGSGCVFSNNANPCNDGNVCTVNESCQAGGCVGGQTVSCNDGNPCTTDACSPAQGCTYNNVYCASTTLIYRMWKIGDDHMDSMSPTEGAPTYISEGPHYRLFTTQGPGFAALHRKFRTANWDHMTTNDANEGTADGYQYEALLGYCPLQPTPQAPNALYRLWNASAGDHMTAWGGADISNALANGYVLEGILCYVQ